MAPDYLPHEKLLAAFDSLFRGHPYYHRDQSRGNYVAAHLYEDLHAAGKSAKFTTRVVASTGVRHRDVRIIGSKGRRGDGTFGDLIPGATAKAEKGFVVKRGPIAQVEIGAETKILAKSMIKQIDRVIGDLCRQVEQFRTTGGSPICIAFVGVNHAEQYVSFEGRRKFPTGGKNGPHPVEEAERAIARLAAVVGYDEFLIMPFRATNQKPYDFEWTNFEKTRQEYAALLTRVSRKYETSF